MKIVRALAAFVFAALPAAAAAETLPPSEPTLSVAGEGAVERSPDVARVAVTIVTSDDVAARSTGKNTDIYNALRARAATLGVAGDALRTTFFNVQFVPHPPRNVPPEQVQPRYGYVTSRSVSLTVAPLENAGKIVDAATAAGVTDIGNVEFDLRDRKGAYRQALAAALEDARANATALAGAGGFRLVRIKNVSSDAYVPVRPGGEAMTMRAVAPASAPAPTEIQPGGPISIAARVNATYDIR